MTMERAYYVAVDDILRELQTLPPVTIDYITFSGAGEPTLAENLGQMIRAVRNVRKEKIAVITNSSLLDLTSVREDLALADMVVAKLDAATQADLEKVNRPHRDSPFEKIFRFLLEFRATYPGRLALQIMFVAANKDSAPAIAELTRELQPDEVHLNTPLRKCAVAPLSVEEMHAIEGYFCGLTVHSVYAAQHVQVRSISDKDTLARRGKVV
jgi:wyosine [tRNA(Phe)-imidazoG37] synthetase (radical SAM superfamily)